MSSPRKIFLLRVQRRGMWEKKGVKRMSQKQIPSPGELLGKRKQQDTNNSLEGRLLFGQKYSHSGGLARGKERKIKGTD